MGDKGRQGETRASGWRTHLQHQGGHLNKALRTPNLHFLGKNGKYRFWGFCLGRKFQPNEKMHQVINVNSQFSEFPLCSVRLSVIATQFPAIVLERGWLLKTNCCKQQESHWPFIEPNQVRLLVYGQDASLTRTWHIPQKGKTENMQSLRNCLPKNVSVWNWHFYGLPGSWWCKPFALRAVEVECCNDMEKCHFASQLVFWLDDCSCFTFLQPLFFGHSLWNMMYLKIQSVWMDIQLSWWLFNLSGCEDYIKTWVGRSGRAKNLTLRKEDCISWNLTCFVHSVLKPDLHLYIVL